MDRASRQPDWSMISAVQVVSFVVLIVLVLVAPFIPSARAANSDVSIVDFAFQPSSISIQVGDTVTWTNNGGVTHTVTSTGGGPLNSGNIAPGNTFSFTFTSEGTFNYHCSIHTTMTGTVTVGSLIPEFSNSAFVVLGLLILLIGFVALGRRR